MSPEAGIYFIVGALIGALAYSIYKLFEGYYDG